VTRQKKKADKNAKNLKTIAEKKHRRNRKKFKISDKVLRNQTACRSET